MSENKKSFKQKLIDSRKNMSNPKRGGIDNFKKRKYVTLQDLYDATLPFLLEEGLILTNFRDFVNEKLVLVTKISDSDSDEFIQTFAICNEEIKIQEQGSELTYNQRYNLGCLLSIRTDFDDDGESIKDKISNKKVLPAQLRQINGLLSVLPPQYEELLLKKAQVNDVKEINQDKFASIIDFLNKKIIENGEVQ